jgi:hypothetical protein
MTTTRTARPQTTDHPYGPEWVARHNAAARHNERVDDGVVSSRHGRRCLTEAVDGACVCR